jgi:hypothetical protein
MGRLGNFSQAVFNRSPQNKFFPASEGFRQSLAIEGISVLANSA